MKRYITKLLGAILAGIMVTLPLCGYTYPGTSYNGNASYEDYYYTRYALADNTSGLTCANVIVPYGWTAYLSVNWEFPSIVTPGVCMVDMYNQDGTAEIHLRSCECFMQANSGGID